MLAATLLVPLGNVRAPLAFSGDLILFAYLLGLMRFVTVLAAMDTGSAFEGMGASREVWVSALAEPALLLALAAVARLTGSLSLSGMFAGLGLAHWAQIGPALALVLAALFVVLLAENARIPVDDPEHASRADHDSRSHGAGSQRAGLRVHSLRRGVEAVGAWGRWW